MEKFENAMSYILQPNGKNSRARIHLARSSPAIEAWIRLQVIPRMREMEKLAGRKEVLVEKAIALL